MYAYVVSFKPTYAPETINTIEEVAQDFSIIGKQYGGDQPNGFIPPSFRITGDGTFDYRPGGASSEALETTSGVLPRSMINDIKILATDDQLESLSESKTPTDCRSMVDGIDYQYQVILSGEQYQLDSCVTRLGYDTDLAQTLEDVWQYLSNPETSASRPIFGDSFYDTAVNFIRENLSPYEE